MTKEILEMIKKAVKENKKQEEEHKIEDIIEANKLYKEIWEDTLKLYSIGYYSDNNPYFWLDNYVNEDEDISEKAEDILINMLTSDGFKKGLRTDLPSTYAIPKEKIIEWSKQEIAETPYNITVKNR